MKYATWSDTISPTVHFRAYDKYIRTYQPSMVEHVDLSQEDWNTYYSNWTPTPPKFEKFPKIPRLKTQCIITEKIDGTNGQVIVDEWGMVYAASRNRLITPEDDNYGFATWVQEHAEELTTLGEGRHFGEWWGYGVQRGYGLSEKRFSLFNAKRWADPESRPSCCGVVPVLTEGEFSTDIVNTTIENLKISGSIAAPGFMNPEGIVVYVAAAKQPFKVHINK